MRRIAVLFLVALATLTGCLSTAPRDCRIVFEEPVGPARPEFLDEDPA